MIYVVRQGSEIFNLVFLYAASIKDTLCLQTNNFPDIVPTAVNVSGLR